MTTRFEVPGDDAPRPDQRRQAPCTAARRISACQARAATRFRVRCPDATVARLATYLRVPSASFEERGVETVSSEELAIAAGRQLGQAPQGSLPPGSYGVRGVGYSVRVADRSDASTLGLARAPPVALIGVGNLGQALAGYGGFSSRGFHIAALLDADPARVGTTLVGLPVRHIDELAEVVRTEGISIAVIATPASAAQDVCDRLAEAGVTAILNFAPTVLVRARPHRRAQGRPGRRAADPVLPRAAQGPRDGRPHRQRRWPAMTLLTVGLSHRTAPVPVLEQLSIPAADIPKLLEELVSAESISEVMILSTCNRVEIYADVSRFHPALADISGLLARIAGAGVAELGDHLYVHFAEAAVEHLFSVASGLDSMVVGESQILGQLRTAYATGTEATTVGRVLHDLVQAALRTGKSVHSDTGIDRAGASIVSVALDRAEEVLGGLAGRSVLIVGAGSMGALSAATAGRRGVGEIVVTNRSAESAIRVARAVGGRAVSYDDHAGLRAEIAAADVLISCTGATGIVLTPADIAPRGERPLAVLDLALPRDVHPGVAALAGVHYIDLTALREAGAMVSDTEVEAATAIVTARLAAYLDEQQQLAVAPTVTALRARAAQVIDAELRRLDGRLPDLDVGARTEVAAAVRRAVEKVLHAPTVRVKELAATPDGDRYAAALRALFDLDPASAESVVAVRVERPPVRGDLAEGGGPR